MALYGLLGEFPDAQTLVNATRAARDVGWREIEAFTPFPVEEVWQALPPRKDRIPLITLCGGVLGGAGGYFMQWYSAVVSYPINVGGRPLNAWPSFIPITFEMTVLGAALAGFFGLLALNRLPRLRHPLFGAPHFDCASRSRFFLCLRARDARFETSEARSLLERHGAREIVEVDE
jgi:hypothetical protein